MSSLPFLPYARPEIGDDEIAEVVDTLRTGWVSTGPKAQRFEHDFAAFLGEPGLHCVSVNSATAGLHLAVEAIGVGPGDEVIVPSLTFTATAEVARYQGADVKIVDIDAATLNIDPAAVEAAITPRTKAIIPVHYAGLAADMRALEAIAARHGLKIIEDAAHALPTTIGGALVGTLDSAATVFSFYANKTITTGEGGMLVTRDEALARRARVMRLHGMNRDAFDRFTSRLPSWHYEIVAPGFKYNLTDIAAALGIHQLRRAHEFRRKRAAIAAAYDRAFADLPLITPPNAPAGELHAWHLYALRLRPEARLSRNAFIEQMHHDGIGCSVHYIPLHLQPYWRDRYGLDPASYPVSQRAFEGLVSLPVYSRMTDADTERVIAAVRAALA